MKFKIFVKNFFTAIYIAENLTLQNHVITVHHKNQQKSQRYFKIWSYTVCTGMYANVRTYEHTHMYSIIDSVRTFHRIYQNTLKRQENQHTDLYIHK